MISTKKMLPQIYQVALKKRQTTGKFNLESEDKNHHSKIPRSKLG